MVQSIDATLARGPIGNAHQALTTSRNKSCVTPLRWLWSAAASSADRRSAEASVRPAGRSAVPWPAALRDAEAPSLASADAGVLW